MKFKIAAIGEVLWDHLPYGKRLGGAPYNFICHAQTLGAEGYLISSVGNDDAGAEIRQQFQLSGLTDKYVVTDTTHPTGSVMISIDKSDQPEYIITNGVAYDYLPLLPEFESLAGGLDAVCFGTLAQRSEISEKTIRKFLDSICRPALKILDINLRQPFYNKAIIEESLRLCSILKLNVHELDVVAGILDIKGDQQRVVNSLKSKYDLDMVALTRGENGSSIYCGGHEYRHCGFKVKVRDTVGAGDAFTAALVIGILRSDPIDKISEDANRIASQVCQIDR